MGDVEEDMESRRFGSDVYADVTELEDFIDATITRIADLKRVF